MRRTVRITIPLVAVALVGAGFATAPVAATAKEFKWRGHAPIGDAEWSNASNWEGGPPGGSVGTLRFPKLGGGCSVTQSTTCYFSSNDLTGLSAQSISLESSQGYSLSGNAVTLGAGGLTAAPATSQCPCGPTSIFLPIVLGADQTWSLAGTLLAIGGKVSGAPHALHVDVGRNMSLDLDDVEAGPVTITGVAQRSAFDIPFVTLERRGSKPVEVNGVDGNPLHVSAIYLRASHAAVGSLSSTNAVVSGTGGPNPGRLSVNGGVTLDKRSEVITYITKSGASPGKDYWQLSARGGVNLGKAVLILDASTSKGFGSNQPCPKLKRGTVETLIKTKGSLAGRFAGVRNKAKVQIDCAGTRRPTVRIRYKKHAVTAKAL